MLLFLQVVISTSHISLRPPVKYCRKELRKAVRRVFCIWQQYTIAQGLSKTYQIGSTPLIPIVPQSKSEVSTLHTKAWQGSTESLV